MYKKKPQGLAPNGTSPTAQTTSEDGEADAPRKTKRVKQIENLNPKSSQASALSVHQSRDIGTEVISRNLDPPPVIRVDDADLDVTIRQAGFGTLSHLLWQTTTESQSQLFINDDFDCHVDVENQQVEPTQAQTYTVSNQEVLSILDLILTTEGPTTESGDNQEDIPRGPSSSFNRQTWWDSLLPLYSNNSSEGARKILQDLKFLLDTPIYWLSFIHFPLFIQNLVDPQKRLLMQPSIVLSALAMATLMRSSQSGLGEEGRKFSLWLRDAAQASLDTSVNASWIEPSLAQAAYFLALYESSAHPDHSASRVCSAFQLLDSLIRALSLTTIDVDEPGVSIFIADEMPLISSRMTHDPINPPPSQSDAGNSNIMAMGLDVSTSTCSCLNMDPSRPPHSHHQLDHSPISPASSFTSLNHIPWNGLMSPHRDAPYTPGRLSPLERPWTKAGLRDDWPDINDIVEVQKEESRRLCWSSMVLISALREYTSLLERMAWDVHMARHENIALLLPGEKMARNRRLAKESIWALHCRISLLWNACQRFRNRHDWRYRRVELSAQAWMEANAIERALAQHICPVGKGMLYAGREYLFQLKLLISNQFTRLIPIPHTLQYERDSAQEWLDHRAGLVEHIRKLAHFVTRFGATAASLALAKRPLSVWWVCAQIKAGTVAWKADPTITRALLQSLDFLAMGDFLTAMWPSDGQRRYYGIVRADLIDACQKAGIEVPAPIPIPGLPPNERNTMTPSVSLRQIQEIEQLPVD
ncbi:hypothetical protein FRC18_003586 [Serendipita sp. 400]|nr:hypothetical protein FRC18_003586 [Serendipita sp. 400]